MRFSFRIPREDNAAAAPERDVIPGWHMNGSPISQMQRERRVGRLQSDFFDVVRFHIEFLLPDATLIGLRSCCKLQSIKGSKPLQAVPIPRLHRPAAVL